MDAAVNQDIERRTQAERTALSDQRMLDAAVELICTRGAAGTTLKDVGEHAGYSRGLASYRFGNKSGLFAFILRAIGESWLQELRRSVAGKTGMAAIEAATDAHYDFITGGQNHIRAFYTLWFDSIGPDEELKRLVANIHERRRRDVTDWITRGIEQAVIKPGVDAAGIADQFCGGIIGIVYQWLVDPSDEQRLKQTHESLKQQTRLALGRNGRAYTPITE